ncbi:replication initiator [Streptomyces sp. VTCC 41912]|uniref:replication initiator n=1 Tax=Streptomyces sp. VTCC 41912 TaxID=3383243 RepID=UPI003896D1D1
MTDHTRVRGRSPVPDALLDPTTLGDLLRVASAPDYDRWADQIHRTGGCSDPIHLTGWTLAKDRTSGETLHHYSTASEPGGRLRLACGNRRASRCPACAWTYAGDTYRLIRAGLAGDDRRDIPAAVRDHPRVFTTLTAPSFGPVHNRPDRYSVTLGALRAARADFRAAQEREALGLEPPEPATVLVLTDWQYAGHGHTPGESALAATIARDIQTNRDTARQARADLQAEEGDDWT